MVTIPKEVTEKEVVKLDVEVKKSRRGRRRAGVRAAKRKARKAATSGKFSQKDEKSPEKCALQVFLMRYQCALRKVPARLPPRVHAGPPSKRIKRVSWREEELSSSMCGGGGGGDPAVLAMGPARRALTYTRDELLRLRESPLVKRNLDQLPPGDRLALVLKKRSESPPNEEDKGGRGDAPNDNQKGVYGRERRSADPRERVRKESEGGGGIVLSPQRRSFTSGCGAPAAPAPPPAVARTRPESPLGATAAQQPAKQDAVRRIGSGRIMVRDGATWEEGEYRPSAEPYRPPRPTNPRASALTNNNNNTNGNNNDRFERRSFGRDSYSSDMKRERDDRFNNEKNRDREDNRRSGGRYSQRRLEKEDEPEWFSGGPTSQHDTIELRGFDEPTRSNENEVENATTNGNKEPSEPERWRDTAANRDSDINDKDSSEECKTEEAGTGDSADFNLDEFLKFDSIPDVLTNGAGAAESGSRFSRWFQKDNNAPDSHYETLLHNMVDELDKSTVPEQQFAPISPAPPSLLQLLRRANTAHDHESSGSGGKIHRLQELEARLRPQPHHAANASDHDLSAFKRLLAQVCGGHAVPAAADSAPAAPPQPMSLLQMLNKSMEQQQQQQQQQQKQQQQQQQQQKPHIPQELLYKLLQLQQRQQPPPAVSELTVNDRELLQRPEAQAIIHGLNAGEITLQHLMQQLHNPGLQSRHRDLLLTVLRVHHQHSQMGGSPLPGGMNAVPPAAPHLVVPPPHHQQLRLSPLPHTAFCVSPIMATSPNALTVHHPGAGGGGARIPSPRELAAHTQSIMQSALIKKKLEEQRENYRRRQEMQHHNKHTTPISFTPTSVLRKMTAEKEAEAPSPKQQWTQPQKVPQGRPIVKGNQSGASLPMNYQPDYQQHYMNQQQQMMAGVRPFGQNQQRQVNNTQFGNVGGLRGIPAGSTLHQLLVQSHQRTLNEMGGAAGSGGGDNQLARWFSPELLARASAGKLPSVHVPNALSLEDLERNHHSPAPPLRN